MTDLDALDPEFDGINPAILSAPDFLALLAEVRACRQQYTPVFDIKGMKPATTASALAENVRYLASRKARLAAALLERRG